MEIKTQTWQETATTTIEQVHHIREEIERQLQTIFPGCRFRMVLRDVPLNGQNKRGQAFEHTVDGKSYWITPTGACDTSEHFQNELLFIQFIQPKNQ